MRTPIRCPRTRPLLVATLFLCLAPVSAMAVNLMDVFTVSLQSDPVFRSVGASNRAAQEGIAQSRAGLLPVISFGATVATNDQDIRRPAAISANGNFDSSSMTLSITQPIYRRDRWIAIGQATTRVRQSDISYAAARQDLMIRVSQRYFGLLQASDDVDFAVASRDAIQQQLSQAKQRFEVGLIAITDVEEAQARYDLANATVIEAENALDNAREALREVSGEYYEAIAPLAVDVPLLVPTPNDIEAWAATALEQNLQLRSANEATLVARDEIQRVEAGHLPTLDLVGTHTRSDTLGGPAGGTDTWTSTLGLQLTVPIYEGGVVLSRTRQSRALYQQSLEDLETVRRSTQRQARDAFLGVRSGISRVKALKQALSSTESALEAVRAGFDVGTRTSVDVLNAQSDLYGARRDYARARYQYILDILSLKQAAGTLSEEDITEVNGWLR